MRSQGDTWICKTLEGCIQKSFAVNTVASVHIGGQIQEPKTQPKTENFTALCFVLLQC